VCTGCGNPVHVPEPVTGPPAAVARFAALRDRDCGPYLVGGMLSMMADNIEHVITYWVLWQQFHSPALTGFQVISHWTPFLLLSVWFGGLADRHDCRRVVQAAQVLFMAVSLAWGVLFLTDNLSIPAACVLLVLHGTAGSLWRPAEQMMLQDFVGRDVLPSAVRLNSTFQGLGVLLGPVVGSALLVGLGPETGILVNALVYLPLTVFLLRTRFTGHTRTGIVARERLGAVGAWRAAGQVMRNPEIAGAIAVAGLTSLFIGSALQTVMPEFAERFGTGSSGTAYGVLLFANGLGGVVGGIVLEATGWVRPNIAAAVVSTFLFGATIAAFAVSGSLVLAVVVLVVGGVANLVSVSVTQTIVQLKADPAERGRTIGVYSMASGGLKVGSGFTIGLLGAVVGVHTSVLISGTALAVGAVAAGLLVARSRRTALNPG
jgi:MFS family permease